MHRWFYLILLSTVGLIISCSQRSELAEEDIPENLPKFEILVNNNDAFDGYIFLRKIGSPGAQFMINNEGKIVWFQLSDTTILRVYTPYEKSYIALYNNKEIHEITYDGDTLLKLMYGNGGFDRPLHHEVVKDNQNHIVALTKEIIPYDLSRFGGDKLDTLTTDGIIVLSKNGEKLWHWSFKSVLDTMKYSDEDIFQIRNDWAHANALFVDKDGHYLISWRDLDQVWKINSQTGEIIWKYGEGIIQDENLKFHKQHSIHLNLDGDYMIFDNGPNKVTWSSRAFIFNRIGNSFGNTFTINLPDSVFSNKQGSVYQFSKDRFLFSNTRTNTLYVTNKQGDVLWSAKSDIGFYRAYYLDREIL